MLVTSSGMKVGFVWLGCVSDLGVVGIDSSPGDNQLRAVSDSRSCAFAEIIGR